MTTSVRVGIAVLIAALASGCVFVQPTEQGRKVRLANGAATEGCRHLGNVTSTVTERIGGIVRRQDTVEDDVVQNAKNAAADMGGDTVVATGKLEGGKQTFGVYRCLAH